MVQLGSPSKHLLPTGLFAGSAQSRSQPSLQQNIIEVPEETLEQVSNTVAGAINDLMSTPPPNRLARPKTPEEYLGSSPLLALADHLTESGGDPARPRSRPRARPQSAHPTTSLSESKSCQWIGQHRDLLARALPRSLEMSLGTLHPDNSESNLEDEMARSLRIIGRAEQRFETRQRQSSAAQPGLSSALGEERWNARDGRRLEAILAGDDPPVALLRANFLVEACSTDGWVMPPRQSLPPEAFVSLDELKSATVHLHREGLPIIALSYTWLLPVCALPISTLSAAWPTPTLCCRHPSFTGAPGPAGREHAACRAHSRGLHTAEPPVGGIRRVRARALPSPFCVTHAQTSFCSRSLLTPSMWCPCVCVIGAPRLAAT